eukprot:2915463-Lingulodinium_polyedra.AAC.1
MATSNGSFVGRLVVTTPHCGPTDGPSVTGRTAEPPVQDAVEVWLTETPRTSTEPDYAQIVAGAPSGGNRADGVEQSVQGGACG